MLKNEKIAKKLEQAEKIAKATDNKRLKEELKEIKNKDGTAYDNEMAVDMNNIANKYNDVSANTISQCCSNAISLDNTQLEETVKDKSLLEKILEFLFGIEFEDKENNNDKAIDFLKKNNLNPITLEPNEPVKIANSNVQIISILEDGHFTACILDKTNKSLILFDPNGSILEQSKFKGCKTKQDVFERIFGKEQAQELINSGFKLYDSNRISNRKNNMNDKNIFDGITITDEQKNGEQTKNGACGHICKMMIDGYLKEREKYENGKFTDVKNTLDTVNSNLDTSYENIVDRKITDALNRVITKPQYKIDVSSCNEASKYSANVSSKNSKKKNTCRNM